MKFTESHEWVNVDGDVATVGVTDHAQKELGDIVYIELPEAGKEVHAKKEAAVLESTKAAADVYSPVSGVVLEANSAVADNTELVNESAEDKGWLFKVKLSNAAELDELMDRESYLAKFS